MENEAGKDYPEQKVIPKIVEGLYKDCKKLIDDVKEIEKLLKKTREGPPKEVGKSLEGVGNKLFDLGKRILELAEKIVTVGQKMLKNGKEMSDNKMLVPALKAKTDVQGKKLEDTGDKLKRIGDNFDKLGEKLENIGGRVKEDSGPKLVDFGSKLKDLGAKIKRKGETSCELGIDLQNLKPYIRDKGKDKANADDMEDIQKALSAILVDLDSLRKVIKYCTYLGNLETKNSIKTN